MFCIFLDRDDAILGQQGLELTDSRGFFTFVFIQWYEFVFHWELQRLGREIDVKCVDRSSFMESMRNIL